MNMSEAKSEVAQLMQRIALEMARWLREEGYTQVLCTTTAPSVYGLYKRGDQ